MSCAKYISSHRLNRSKYCVLSCFAIFVIDFNFSPLIPNSFRRNGNLFLLHRCSDEIPKTVCVCVLPIVPPFSYPSCVSFYIFPVSVLVCINARVFIPPFHIKNKKIPIQKWQKTKNHNFQICAACQSL